MVTVTLPAPPPGLTDESPKSIVGIDFRLWRTASRPSHIVQHTKKGSIF